jgi:carboxymethylenebutenolidase
VTRRLAKLGALAVTGITGIPQLLPIVYAKPDAELLSDLDSTVAWAKSARRQHWPARHHRLLPRRPHGLGICRPFERAESGCFLLWTPGRSAEPAVAEEPDAVGARDEGAGAWALRRGRSGHSRATVEALKEALAKANKAAAFKIYPGAPHGFHADYRPSYRKEAAEDAWNEMQGWFRKYQMLG